MAPRALATLLSTLALASAGAPAARADTLTVVAIGASNTSGWGVGEKAAYPAHLEALLRERGLDARVVNAGKLFDTTGGMLARLDAAVPPETALVVVQPGANDLRLLGTRERRAANIAAMVARLSERGIRAIVYDPAFPPEAYQWDRVHISADGHVRIAQELLPQVLEVLQPPPAEAGKGGRPKSVR